MEEGEKARRQRAGRVGEMGSNSCSGGWVFGVGMAGLGSDDEDGEDLAKESVLRRVSGVASTEELACS